MLDCDPFVLSPRLLALTEWIPEGSRVADIGADHAYLLIHLAKTGRLSHGIVGELNHGPYENARRSIAGFGVADFIDVRLGNGLSVLGKNEVDVIVIAGMGGSLICQILAEGKEKLENAKRLVLQPNIGGRSVRLWLKENGFRLAGEMLVDDGGILYEALVAKHGEETVYEEIGELSEETLAEIGPLLWKNRHPLLKWKVEQIWNAKQRIFNGLQNAKSQTAIDKRRELETDLKEWERVKKCLCTDLT
ncbi:tRNA (adenine(22)-N(1))-methyltransferase [Thermoactinomyces mirandus]|uniref:SAM-dependent methyltransferase n=1 Tax=Thermoactinomyces mirandus TaxID=2756294 RepID=A0A7W1XPC0_9BACL|nr:class I SAM-dependent methyltransferase [Thermoactinomyces mirandus]MBA4600734.1 SAM-dependent methyltransferase [Thermoactinomyces mirandus]